MQFSLARWRNIGGGAGVPNAFAAIAPLVVAFIFF